MLRVVDIAIPVNIQTGRHEVGIKTLSSAAGERQVVSCQRAWLRRPDRPDQFKANRRSLQRRLTSDGRDVAAWANTC